MTRFLKLVLMFFMRTRGLGTAPLLGAVKRKGLRTYFRAVNGVRRLLIVVIALSVLLNIMVTAAFGLIATASWLYIQDEHLRLNVLLGAFGTAFFIPLLGGWYLLSERFWMRLSGAKSLVGDR